MQVLLLMHTWVRSLGLLHKSLVFSLPHSSQLSCVVSAVCRLTRTPSHDKKWLILLTHISIDFLLNIDVDSRRWLILGRKQKSATSHVIKTISVLIGEGHEDFWSNEVLIHPVRSMRTCCATRLLSCSGLLLFTVTEVRNTCVQMCTWQKRISVDFGWPGNINSFSIWYFGRARTDSWSLSGRFLAFYIHIGSALYYYNLFCFVFVLLSLAFGHISRQRLVGTDTGIDETREEFERIRNSGLPSQLHTNMRYLYTFRCLWPWQVASTSTWWFHCLYIYIIYIIKSMCRKRNMDINGRSHSRG